MNSSIKGKPVGVLGVSSVLLLVASLLLFGSLDPNFSFIQDYISQLGAKGAPYALWWNLIGFIGVGLLLIAFGYSYGVLLKDRFLAVLLSAFGVGFALTAIPIDMEYTDANVSKAHILMVCLGLASWLFGLSRLSYNPKIDKRLRRRANIAAVLIVISILGTAIEIWSMPITYRLVFGIVFAWTTITSIELILKNNKAVLPD